MIQWTVLLHQLQKVLVSYNLIAVRKLQAKTVNYTVIVVVRRQDPRLEIVQFIVKDFICQNTYMLKESTYGFLCGVQHSLGILVVVMF